MATEITMYVCDNCPVLPQYHSMEALQAHWDATHNVPMIVTEIDPWGQRPPRTKQLFHLIHVQIDTEIIQHG